jgi:23S rRNA pseudouridine1911/1915/1917 synthase
MHRELTVPEAAQGQRLDRWLCDSLPGLSRASARRLIDDGEVRLNTRRTRAGQRIAAGDRVTVPEQAGPNVARAEPELELRVCYEDAHLIAVDKPAGMPCHPLRPGERGTLAGALLARYPELAGVGYSAAEPGIVHRLDTDTSGLVLAARDPLTFTRLRAQLEGEQLDKRYLALCAGAPVAPSVQHAWLSARGPSVRVALEPFSAALPITTELLVATATGIAAALHGGATRDVFSLVELRVHRARRHQIRAHLAVLGHPLAGDTRYGGPALPGLTHHFLHASEVRLQHPCSGEALVLRAALAPELQAVWDALQS